MSETGAVFVVKRSVPASFVSFDSPTFVRSKEKIFPITVTRV